MITKERGELDAPLTAPTDAMQPALRVTRVHKLLGGIVVALTVAGVAGVVSIGAGGNQAVASATAPGAPAPQSAPQTNEFGCQIAPPKVYDPHETSQQEEAYTGEMAVRTQCVELHLGEACVVPLTNGSFTNWDWRKDWDWYNGLVKFNPTPRMDSYGMSTAIATIDSFSTDMGTLSFAKLIPKDGSPMHVEMDCFDRHTYVFSESQWNTWLFGSAQPFGTTTTTAPPPAPTSVHPTDAAVQGTIGTASASACGDPGAMKDAIDHSDSVSAGVTYQLVAYRCVADYGYVEISASSGGAAVLMQRVNGVWKVLDLGTSIDEKLVPPKIVAALNIPPQ